MKITATVAGEIREIPDPSLADLVAFERHFGISSTALAPQEGETSDVRMEWIAFLAYRGLVRIGAVDKAATFDEVLEQIEDFQLDEDADADTDSETEEVPLAPAAS